MQVPLITHDGLAIGTLCVVNKKTRNFTANDTELLKGLANIVMDEIQLRFAAIEESEKQKSPRNNWLKVNIVGQPLLRGMPEMAGQPVFDIIFKVYRTGEPYYGFESPIIMTHDGKTETAYFNYAYTPLLENGKIIGVLQDATEISDQIRFRKEL